MTEKEFRRLVTDLEISSDEKNEINHYFELTKKVIETIKSNNFIIEDVVKAGSLAKGTMLNDTDDIDIMVKVKTTSNKPTLLVNEAVINEIINAFIFNCEEITKLGDITRTKEVNRINIRIGSFKVYIYVRYEEDIYKIKDMENQIAFTEIANRDYTYFRNAVKIIKYYKETQKININGYAIEILLYYSLNEYFKDNRYEDYLNNFIRGIDDLLKSKRIEVSKDIYQKLNINEESNVKATYVILDMANSNINLIEGINEFTIGEFRKLKKALSKLVDTKSTLQSSTSSVVININPIAIKDSDLYSWSYKIEGSDYYNNGGAYQNTESELITAMLKGLFKGLRALVDNNLNKRNVEIICSKKNILKLIDQVNEDNRSRIKNIEAYLDNNGINITFK